MISFIWARDIHRESKTCVHSNFTLYFPRDFLKDSLTVNYAVNYRHEKTNMLYWNISIAFRLEVEIKNVVTNNG
jgi:hypothetical protein